jgi:hypothetical protein
MKKELTKEDIEKDYSFPLLKYGANETKSYLITEDENMYLPKTCEVYPEIGTKGLTKDRLDQLIYQVR